MARPARGVTDHSVRTPAKGTDMSQQIVLERFFESLINGDRPAARQIVNECEAQGIDPRHVMTDLFWPTYETIEKLWKQDQLTSMSYHFATRLLRVLIDQSAMKLNLSSAGTGRTILAACGTSQSEELGAQMAIDLLEDSGYSVRFMGGGVSPDEIMAQVQEVRPDVLLMFCSAASDLPGIRFIIDNMREIGGNDKTQIVVGGGVFNRAEGLAEEIGADLWAADPLELVDSLTNEAARRATANQRTVGKTRVNAPAAKPANQTQQAKTKTRAAA